MKRLLQRHGQRPTAELALQDPFIVKNVPVAGEFPARPGPRVRRKDVELNSELFSSKWEL